MQQFQINLQFKEFLKQDMYRLIGTVQNDFEKLFTKKVELTNGEIVDFGDLVDGLAEGEPKDEKRFAALLRKLNMLNGRFHESIKLYKDNTEVPFGFGEQRTRLEEIHQFITANKKYFTAHEQLNIDLAAGFYKII